MCVCVSAWPFFFFFFFFLFLFFLFLFFLLLFFSPSLTHACMRTYAAPMRWAMALLSTCVPLSKPSASLRAFPFSSSVNIAGRV